MNRKLPFASDYMRGAHPNIIARLAETNMAETGGYGLDPYSEAAKARIRKACACEDAEVELLVGGTQTNSTVIDALLRSYQGVIAAQTGHISTHESGAIEACGHKVLTLPHTCGKISAASVRGYLRDFHADENHELHEICAEYRIPLYVDGARLAYALACPSNDVTLPDLAKYCDAFYIGGTKCGALFGEAVVIPDPDRIPHFFTIIKQHGALLAKGRILGIQFDELFKDDLYLRIGEPAIRAADRIREALAAKDYQLCFGSPTNQIFCVMENGKLREIGEKVKYSFWEKFDEDHTVIRFATDWAVTEEETEALIGIL